MEKKVNADTILNFLRKAVEMKTALNPDIWIDAATKLNLFLFEEDAKTIELENEYSQEVNRVLDNQLEEKRNLALAERIAKLSPQYRAFVAQQRRVERIEEQIRIAKKRSDRSAGM